MEKKVTVVIASKKSAHELKDLLSNIEHTIDCLVDIMIFQNNENDLTTVYSEALNQTKNEINIFIHDDVEFLRQGWGKEIIRLFDKYQEYGIIGIAGSAEFNDGGMWWTNKKIYGQVLHRSEGKSWLSTYSPLLKKDLEEVCVIDGLFMAIHKNRISQTFDKNIKGFHFYDIDLCLNNYLDGETKIGVTTNIRLAHSSIGELDEKWFINREIINKKYGEYYPI